MLHYFARGSQQTFSFWACFHEKEGLLRVKCLLCIALLVSEQCEQAQSTSAEQLKHHKTLGLLALPWMFCLLGSVCSHPPCFLCSWSSTKAPGTTCHLPQSPGWVFLSVYQSQSSRACVCHVPAFS